jgi:hypothetical protein
MFQAIKNLLSAAGTQLAPVAPPKVKKGSMAWPSFFTSTQKSNAVIAKPDRRLANTDVTTLRSGASTTKVIQDFCVASPELSSAIYSALRVGIPEKYSAVARNMDGSFNEDATNLVQQLLSRIDIVGNYVEDGFSGTWSIKSISESLAKELLMYGACSMELVLDKSRLPARMQPISVTSIEFIGDNKQLRPVQKVGGDEFDLDIPTFFWVALDQSLLNPYPSSPMESALQAVIFKESFINDLRRVISRVAHPRQKVVINEERVRKNLSQEAQMDEAKAVAELNAIIASVESKINGLRPEDALVYLDSIGFEVEAAGASGLSAEYATLTDISNSRLASGSKTLPSVLGLSAGSSSSNISSTEAMLYVRSVDGAIRQKLNEIYSRALTLSLRLFGQDVYVVFEYDTISMRPDMEMEAFRQTKQMRNLELLSLGLISDAECALTLTGKLPPPGYKPLSGTMFKTGSIAGASPEAPQAPSNNGSTLNQNLAPDTPSTARGQNKRAEVVSLRN